MDENTMVIAVAGIAVNGLVIAVLGRAWLSRRPPPPIPHEQLENIEMRLVQLQQAVDDVAIEMERVAEGQRFTAKLLAERGESDGPAEHSISPR
ncbi:MAG: hypothetical protein M3303_07200 [Gemmatimonadota bacterium]|nr:hypothetical protein [Gemmatimonadota bacterium]